MVQKLITHDSLAPSGNYDEMKMMEMKRTLLKHRRRVTKKPDKRVFISRKNSDKRILLNEQSLIPILESFGFNSYHMEALDHEDQIALMHETEILIGQHGAGLTNMLFLPEGATVIELRAEFDNYNNCYFNLASALNHPYYYIECQTKKSTNDHIGEFHINSVQFEGQLKNIFKKLM